MSLTKLELGEPEPFEGGRAFGDRGAFELLRGRATFTVDPSAPANAGIVDLADALAPGQAFWADVLLLRPGNAARANGRLLLEVPNRGNVLAFRFTDVAPSTEPAAPGDVRAGDGWLLRQGYTMAWCGWQQDVPEVGRLLHVERLEPRVDGTPITGRVRVRFRPDEPATTLPLSDRGHLPYPAADVEEAAATLVTRAHPEAPDEPIDRAAWRFSDPTHVELRAGFEPGRFYELTYTAAAAQVTGHGLLATRDLAAHLRPSYDGVLAWGASQSGGFLRTFLSLGLDRDEHGERAVDGVLPFIAGGYRAEVNHRWAHGSYFGPGSLAYLPPHANAELQAHDPDPVKTVYLTTSAEYWTLAGALAHTSPDGARDLAPPPAARLYHAAGTQHGGGVWPLTRYRAEPTPYVTEHPINVVEHRALLRAALVNLDAWVFDGVEPPPSRHPRIDDGTLVPHDALAARPAHVLHFAGAPLLVPAADGDGNDLAGIKLPEVAVPVAAHTGWNVRATEIGGAGQLLPLAGATLPFSPEEISHRYASREDYERRARAVAAALVAERYLLAEDVEHVVAEALLRHDAFTTPGAASARP
jgi:hypothetical protein